jgi:putative ABC transport system permease protein
VSRLETLRIAVRGVLANRLRSALTMLGILIGVASVVTLVAVGNGSTIAVQKQFQSLGTNAVQISSGGFGRRGPGGGGGGSSVKLTMADVKALQDKQYAKTIKAVVPIVEANGATATFEGATTAIGRFNGTTPELEEAGSYTVKTGQFISGSDVTNRRRVVAIGSTVANNLFDPGVDPLGKTVQFNHINFQVIGLLGTKGSNGFQDLDDIVIAPWTAVRDTLSGGSSLDGITVQAVSPKATTDAQSIATDVIAKRNGKNPAGNNLGFRVRNATSLLQSSTQTTHTLTVLLGAVAAISLLVGGIGIMNIMLVTVTERTREIGIRKAIGAPKRLILEQFLMESVVLGLFGGVFGVITGFVGSNFKIVGVKPVVSYPSVFLALGVAVAVSLFFGIYPANRAASLRPIDALRHE